MVYCYWRLNEMKSANIIKLQDGREVELESKHYEAIIQEQRNKGAMGTVSTWKDGHLISMNALDADLASAMVIGMGNNQHRYEQEAASGNHLGYVWDYIDKIQKIKITVRISLN
jgi:predicted phosphatase